MATNLIWNMHEVMKDPETTKEQLVLFEERLWKAQNLSESKFMKSLFFFVVTSTAWFIIESAAINKISYLGMEFEEFSIPLLVLPPIAAFFYYRFQCEAALQDLIKKVLRVYYSQNLRPFEKRNLTELLISTSFYDFELITEHILENKSSLLYKTSFAWGVLMDIILLFIPILFMLWMSYNMLTSPIIGFLWSIISSTLVLVFVVRSLLVLYTNIRTSGQNNSQ